MDSPPLNPCLGIGLPSCLRDLPVPPPVSLADSKDQQVFDAIRALGIRSQVPQEEVEKACCLAAGPADLVILLERPGPNHDYTDDFEDFVRRCSTLQAIDELIRFSSKGARSIHTTSVLDAFLLKPSHTQALPADTDCFNTVEQILTIKQPRVLVCCWKGECQNENLSQFRSRGVGSLPMRSRARLNGKEIINYHSFHPATAVWYNQCQPVLRALLAYHFAAAFLELRHPQEPPEWAIEISKMAANTSTRNEHLSVKAAVNSFRSSLLIILGLEKIRSVRFRTQPTVSRVWRDDIFTLVNYLPTTSYQHGALQVAKATLLWRKYFSKNPEFQKVLSQLLDLGNRQSAFYHTSSILSTTGLEESLLLLKFDEPARSPVCPSDQAEEILQTIRLQFDDGDLRDIRRQATDLSAHLQNNLELPELIAHPLWPALWDKLRDFLQKYITHLEKTVGLINAMPAYLGGARGQYNGEEQPPCSIMALPYSSFILDQVIALLEARISQERLCSVLACDVIGRSELVGLFDRCRGAGSDDILELVREAPSVLRQRLRLLEKGIYILYAMVEERGGG
ncbi:hypothetical protein Asppvi_003803 [Aspergillus pseudoviridinutans]|uniref:Uncharacterized protein n=1 Tax=Aspergillus pseudoviridinutans TaxID=1517512 RepID=A0A9P3BAQ0_9EURO|nr:uncharacterized protein Asppvi_003803 [Aspergillus pseudoviridinutans]GIJ84948.1 hypothetical protein Asppvi_003803 [Aspergillus pseudoviridinutans]